MAHPAYPTPPASNWWACAAYSQARNFGATVTVAPAVDEKKLEEEAKKPQTYKWPGAKLKDGSVSDY